MGFSSGFWQIALMSALTIGVMSLVVWSRSRFGRFDEKDTVWISSGGIALGKSELPRRSIFWKSQWHDILLNDIRSRSNPEKLEEVLQQRRESDFAAENINPFGLSIWLGVSSENSFEIDLAESGPHLLVVGPTGSGKSELLKLATLSLLAGYPDQIEFAYFDFKGGATLAEFSDSNNCIGIATDLDLGEQLVLWQRLDGIMKLRELEYSKALVPGFLEYNRAGGNHKRVVVIIDEFAAVLASGISATNTVDSISARGRSLGVHLIAATQSLSGIPRSLLTNLRLRVAMASSDPIDFVQLGISPPRQKLQEQKGWANAYISRSNQACERFSFLLGAKAKPIPQPVTLMASSAQPLLARSQQLLRMYSDQVPVADQLEEHLANQGSQSPLHREVLHWLGRK
jgi:energy-coupling factor transporter ATP-binding protein EcfA2